MKYIVLLLVLLGVCGGSLFVWFLYAAITNSRLLTYLGKTNYPRWQELTTFGGVGPGASNAFKTISYIANDLDNEDQVVLKYKTKIRLCLKLVLTSIAGMTIVIVALILLTRRV